MTEENKATEGTDDKTGNEVNVEHAENVEVKNGEPESENKPVEADDA